MKKSIKILTLVLSLALICGALVVAAFADNTTEITGIRVDTSGDFENPMNSTITTVTTGSVTTDLDKDNGAAKVLMFKHQVGGTPVLVTSPYEDNTYITVDWGNTTGNTSFLEHYTAINGWGTYTDDTKEYFDGFKYYVVDFDVAWFDVANAQYGFFYPYTVYTNAAGAGRVEANAYLGLDFRKDDGEMKATLRGDDGTKYALGNEKWSHVTWIMEPIASTDGEGNKSLTVKQYLAIDGIVVDTYEWTDVFDVATMYNGDPTKLYTLDVRLDVFGKKASSGCIDNYNFRTFLPEYNGNLADVLAGGVGADLKTFESSLYKDGYKMPFGKPMATVDGTYYDSVEKAIAAAGGATPVVLADNVAAPIVVNEAAIIECGEYTIAEIVTGEGIDYNYNEETKTYTFTETQDRYVIMWGACTCGLDSCDDTHPGNLDTMGWPGTTIAATYTKNLNWTLADGIDVYTLTGWKNEETGEVVDIEAIITPEMCNDPGYVFLTPVIEKETAEITYVQGGAVKYATGANAFRTALDNADSDTVITLLDDVVYTPETNLKVLKNITINLNGHVLDMLTTYKGQYFQIGSGKTFTVLGEEEGSALIAGYSKGANAAGGTLFSSTGTNPTITLKGKGLFVSCAALYGAWGNYHATINIEDCYLNHNGATENSYNIYISSGSGNAAAFTLNIKNAVVKGLTAGVYSGSTTVQTTVNIENSVILSQILTASSSTTNINAVVNVKGNSYINGSLNKATKVNVTGENNYFDTNDWISKATFEEGVALMNATGATFDHVNYGHSWVVSAAEAEWDHAATLAVTAAPETKTYAYKAAVGITVNFYDGENLLGFAIGEPGMKVIGPAAGAAYPVADGWVMATKSYAYTIPANAKADINVDITEVTEFDYAYSKGAPSIYTNFDITDNLCNNLYVPTTLPEGIENFKIYLDKVEEGKERPLTPGYTINGQAYSVTSRWPGPTGADGSLLYIIKFTYEGVEFTFNADTGVTGYAKKVYDIYKDDAEKVEQMTALLQYVDAANRLGGFTPTTAFTELYNEVKANYTVREVPVAEGNVDALSAYLGGAELYAGYNAGLMFKIKDTTVTFKIVGSNGTIDGIVGDKGVSAGYYGTGNYNFGIWAAAPFTIQVIDGEGEVIAEGEYSLAAYYNSVKATASEDELAVIQAIYVLGAIGNVNK